MAQDPNKLPHTLAYWRAGNERYDPDSHLTGQQHHILSVMGKAATNALLSGVYAAQGLRYDGVSSIPKDEAPVGHIAHTLLEEQDIYLLGVYAPTSASPGVVKAMRDGLRAGHAVIRQQARAELNRPSTYTELELAVSGAIGHLYVPDKHGNIPEELYALATPLGKAEEAGRF